jgi:hypothetical protein
MKEISVLLVGLLLCGAAAGEESRDADRHNEQRVAKRTIEWLVYDEWGQPDKQYKHARGEKGVTRWRESFAARRNPSTIAVKVHREGHRSRRFLYTLATREMTESEPVPDPPRLLLRPGGGNEEGDAYSIAIHMGPRKDAGWNVGIEAGKKFFIHVVEHNGEFVVRRHEDTWILD